MGHRMPLGLAINPVTGDIWECENGPNGGDEVNILAPGKNYGRPEVSYGRFYAVPWSTNPYREGMEPPVIYWCQPLPPPVSPSYWRSFPELEEPSLRWRHARRAKCRAQVI